MAVESDDFATMLAGIGVKAVAGVPCSLLKAAIAAVQMHPELSYVTASNEGPALGIACGHELAGRRAAVILQDSGFGNLINPLTSLALTYGLAPLLIVSRHDGRTDEAQHRAMASLTDSIIADLGLGQVWLRPETNVDQLRQGLLKARESPRPVVLSVVRHAVAATDALSTPVLQERMSRSQAMELLLAQIPDRTPIIAATGYIARELHRLNDRRRNFYMLGSMGHAAAIALGLTQVAVLGDAASPEIVVLDGDGAALMHLGLLSTVGAYGGPGLIHIILDNEVYETTGGQTTLTGKTSLAAVGAACGYRSAMESADAVTFQAGLVRAHLRSGPHLIVVKIRPTSLPVPASVLARKSPEEIRDHFRSYTPENAT